MKKLIFILLVLSIVSCSQIIVKNVYQKTYPSTQIENAYLDLYSQLDKYGVDSIPLENWITNKMVSDTTIIIQKMIKQNVDNKTSYQFIFSSYKYPKSGTYQITIRYSGKNE